MKYKRKIDISINYKLKLNLCNFSSFGNNILKNNINIYKLKTQKFNDNKLTKLLLFRFLVLLQSQLSAFVSAYSCAQICNKSWESQI